MVFASPCNPTVRCGESTGEEVGDLERECSCVAVFFAGTSAFGLPEKKVNAKAETMTTTRSDSRISPLASPGIAGDGWPRDEGEAWPGCLEAIHSVGVRTGAPRLALI